VFIRSARSLDLLARPRPVVAVPRAELRTQPPPPAADARPGLRSAGEDLARVLQELSLRREPTTVAASGDGDAAEAASLATALEKVNQKLAVAFDDGALELRRDLRAALAVQATTLEDSSQRALRLDLGPSPQVQVYSDRLEEVLALGRSPAEVSALVSGVSAFANVLPAVADRSEQADGAAERAEDLRVGVARDRVQLAPGVAAGLDRVAAERVHGLLDSATTEYHDTAKPRVIVSGKARQAYGLGLHRWGTSGPSPLPLAAARGEGERSAAPHELAPRLDHLCLTPEA
jgi:hypothetical protein